jgi:hypothetical protein
MPRMPTNEGPGAGPPEETPRGDGGHAADRLREFEIARGLEDSEVVATEEPVIDPPTGPRRRTKRRSDED